MHTAVFLQAASPEYTEHLFDIIEAAAPCKIITFVFQDNLDGIFAPRDRSTEEPISRAQLQKELDEANELGRDYYADRLKSRLERVDRAIELQREIEEFRIRLLETTDVAPFYQRSDVTIRIQEFLEDIEQGVFLRLYVPSDRYQSDQLRSLLTVLERYMKQVEGTSFGVDARKSDRGVVYLFKMDANSGVQNELADLFSRFDSFMRICGDDPKQAESLLKQQGHSGAQSTKLVGTFSRDYKRLLLDTRHEYESKLLTLRQRMESEMIEGNVSIQTPNLSAGLANLIPNADSSNVLNVTFENVSVVNTNLQTEIDQIVNGSITYNDNDKLIQQLIMQNAEGIESAQLMSDLDQLKDETVASTNRSTAKQRIIAFLRRAKDAGGKVLEKTTITTLSKYLLELL